MNEVDLTGVAWFKSSRSNAQSACVEVAFTGDGSVPIRDSKDPDGPALVFPPDSWSAFLGGVKAGDFPLV